MSKATFTNEYWNSLGRGKEEQGEPISVSLDFDCPVWHGWSLAYRWGSGIDVAFDKQTCDAIAKQWEQDNGEFVLFVDDENGGRYEVYEDVTDWPNNPIEVFEFCGYAPDGSPIYPLGSGSWCWGLADSYTRINLT